MSCRVRTRHAVNLVLDFSTSEITCQTRVLHGMLVLLSALLG